MGALPEWKIETKEPHRVRILMAGTGMRASAGPAQCVLLLEQKQLLPTGGFCGGQIALLPEHALEELRAVLLLKPIPPEVLLQLHPLRSERHARATCSGRPVGMLQGAEGARD